MLASIQKIISISPIEGADKIEKANVLGWECVVKKGICHEGDLVVFVETDTKVPKKFLSDNPEDTELVRLTVVKMKGQISQGLVLPLSILPEDIIPEEGLDVKDIIGVEKYEKKIPQNMMGLLKGGFPNFITKTDEVRIQSEPELIQKLWGLPFYITQKMDGTSCTIYKLNGEVHVCSRNYEVGRSTQTFHEKTNPQSENVYWRAVDLYNLENIIPEGYYIQGEIFGSGINGNNMGLDGIEFNVFNAGKIGEGRLPYPEIMMFCNDYGLKIVPVLLEQSNFQISIPELELLSNGFHYITNDSLQEGIVVRSFDQRISFKVINPFYALKYKE